MEDSQRSNISSWRIKAAELPMGRIDHGVTAIPGRSSEPQIDNRESNQSEAARVLKRIRDEMFDSSYETLALALLGRADGTSIAPRNYCHKTF